MPLPVPLGQAIEGMYGDPGPAWVDERFRSWRAAATFEGAGPPFDPALRARYERERAAARVRFQRAGELDRAVAALQPNERG